MFQTDEMRKKEIEDFLAGVVGCCEVTNYEKHMLWMEYSKEALAFGLTSDAKFTRYEWKAGGHGLGETVGYLADMPVHMTLWCDTIDGQKILFYEPTSMVVDNRMIQAWLEDNLPKTAFRADGYINKTDAMNFCNVLR
jgi:hypothetical protein